MGSTVTSSENTLQIRQFSCTYVNFPVSGRMKISSINFPVSVSIQILSCLCKRYLLNTYRDRKIDWRDFHSYNISIWDRKFAYIQRQDKCMYVCKFPVRDRTKGQMYVCMQISCQRQDKISVCMQISCLKWRCCKSNLNWSLLPFYPHVVFTRCVIF